MNQDELLKKIRKSAESVPTPQGLSPEYMIDRLNHLQTSSGFTHKKQNHIKKIRYGTAAVLAVSAAIVMLHSGFFQNVSQSLNESLAPFYQQTNEAETRAALNSTQKDNELADAKKSYAAASYEQIYGVIEDQIQKQNEDTDSFSGNDYAVYETAAAEMAGGAPTEDTGREEAGIAQNEHSDTNVQTEGVDEGDVVKTDGQYLYITSKDRTSIQIVKAKEGQMDWMGEIKGTETILEFYIYENKLSVIKQQRNSETDSFQTCLETYDVTNPDTPRLSGRVMQDGFYKSSRRVDGYIYLFTGYQIDGYAAKEELRGYVPSINAQLIPYECIYIPDNPDISNYLVVSSLDLMEPGRVKDKKALMADGDNFYVSRENIYCALSQNDFRANQFNYTELFKFTYADGFISYQAHGLVNGILNDQFSMDEYEGSLRLVTTMLRQYGKSTNSLWILDSELNLIGGIQNLAPDEQIYSARFLGDTGYFVTFKNMDPLFSVDLSDPANPKILGELKITGFSEYLHFFTDDILLGIGSEINPDTQNFEGLKLSMFDISDPGDVEEVHKIVESSYEYTPAFSQHKSVLISQTRNLIGFPVEKYDYDLRQWGICYAVYSYDETKGFVKLLECELDEYGDMDMTRGIYIGDYLYIVNNRQILAFDLEEFKMSGQMKY